MSANGASGIPRIVIEPSGHRLLNHGDTAMLQVAVRRLRELWPAAAIGVITADPDGLRHHVTGVDPIPAAGRYEVIDDGAPLPSRRDRVLAAAGAVRTDLAAAERTLGGPLGEPARDYLGALANADLFVVSGRGGVCDAFHHESSHLLDEIEAATDLGVPVAMMGQGLGPVEHPFLRQRASEVLPKVALLALREGRASLPLARALGVPDHRVVVTGDDALELVVEHGARHRAPRGLGVNLRVAAYAAVGEDDVAQVGTVVRSVAGALGTDLVGIPISEYPEEDDRLSIERLSRAHGPASAGEPAEAIRHAASCRVAVTGSYHAALFALAQGVPVVGLARSGYYLDKLLGLAERFGTGITVVSLDAPDLGREVEQAVRRWWDVPAAELEPLPASARRQVEDGRAAWRRLAPLVAARPEAPPLAPAGGAAEMVVESLETRSYDGVVERSALFRWTGGERRIAIAVSAELAAPDDDDASPFLPLALLPAMVRGDDLVVDAPVSARLLRGARAASELLVEWAPGLRAPGFAVADERVHRTPAGRAIGSFFSRGVDSTYSAAVPRAYPGPIERLLFVRGFDPNLSPPVLAEEVRAAGRAAELLGLPLSVLSTDVHDLMRLFASSWEDVVGMALAAVGLAVSGGLHTVVVPSTDAATTLGPNGTSPALDQLFSSEATEVIHDSVAHGRIGKCLWLARNRPDLLEELKVCLAEDRPDNCGRCGKCLTMMATLRGAGMLGAAKQFPDTLDLDLLREKPARLHARIEYIPLLKELEDGRDPELREAILDVLAQPMWTYPGPPMRRDTPGFRNRDGARVVSIIRDGLPWPPPAPDAAPPGLGLVRAIDTGRGRHVYGVGRVPAGELVGELGSLPRDQTEGLEPVYVTTAGHLVTERARRPGPSAGGLRAGARWAVAPLGWRGSGIAARDRARAVAERGARLLRHRRAASGEPVARVASIHVHPTPARLPLFSALHPVTGDQLLTTQRLEAADLGYGEPELLGYVDRAAPVTGTLGVERRDVPWASRFGRRVRLG